MSILKIKNEQDQWEGIPAIKGDPGVFIGEEEPEDLSYKVWINPNGVLPSGVSEQYGVMPEAAQADVDKIIQYVGPTNEYFTNGYFYKGVEDLVGTGSIEIGENLSNLQVDSDTLTTKIPTPGTYDIVYNGTDGWTLDGESIDLEEYGISVDGTPVDGDTLKIEIEPEYAWQQNNSQPEAQSLPSGGTTGQVLKKSSNEDYDTEWGDDGGSESNVKYLGETRLYTTTNRLNLDDLEEGKIYFILNIIENVNNMYIKGTYGGVEYTLDLSRTDMNYQNDTPIYIKKRYDGEKWWIYISTQGGWDGNNTKLTKSKFSYYLDNYGFHLSTSGYYEMLPDLLNKEQTVTAKKTFNTLPESSITPTTNNQFVNKKYVDDNSIPTGGTTGQVLAKASGTDKDVEWKNISVDGGTIKYTNTTNALPSWTNNSTGNLVINQQTANYLVTNIRDAFSKKLNPIFTFTYYTTQQYEPFALKYDYNYYVTTKPSTMDLLANYITPDGTTNVCQVGKIYITLKVTWDSNNLPVLNGTDHQVTRSNTLYGLSIYNRFAYTPTNDYHPATKKYVDDNAQKTQYTTMPASTAANVGMIVQYAGTTNENFTNGYYYRCEGSSSTGYGWVRIDTQPIQRPSQYEKGYYSLDVPVGTVIMGLNDYFINELSDDCVEALLPLINQLIDDNCLSPVVQIRNTGYGNNKFWAYYERTNNGVSYEYEGNKIHVNGTATATSYSSTSDNSQILTTLSAGNYKYKVNTHTAGTFQIMKSDDTLIADGDSGTFTLSSDTTLLGRVKAETGETFDNEDIYIWIAEENDNPTPEQFTATQLYRNRFTQSGTDYETFQFEGTCNAEYKNGFPHFKLVVSGMWSEGIYGVFGAEMYFANYGPYMVQNRWEVPATAENEGQIMQYIGETTSELTKGYFYQCVSDGGTPATYSWVNVTTQKDVTTGDQTLTGVKTFTSLPVSSVTPTSNNQLVNKKYVDDAISGGGLGDMLKSVYDTNNNGIVDNAEKVNNHTVLKDVPSDAKFTDTTYNNATTSAAGLMSSADKTSLNNLVSAVGSVSSTDISHWNTAYNNNHTHSNKTVLDGVTSTKVSNWDTAYSNTHTHSNKTVLDGITSTKTSNWDTAYTNNHTHSNKSVIDGITATDITNWNKTHIYSGTSVPDASVGENGDIYVKYSA